MNKQLSLSAINDELAQVRTKKKEFLSKIDRIIPWGEWLELIRPHYYKGERGNKPYDPELMLRIYLAKMKLTILANQWEAVMSTNDRILDEALTLFSENGYDGTSVEQIAEKVGIKAPSLYKHFRGKEDILNAIIDNAEARYEESFGSEKHIGRLPDSKEKYVRITMEKISFTIHDPMIRKIRKFLVQEQFRSERLAEITTKHRLDGLLGIYKKIIGGMMDKGMFRQDDPTLLAVEITAPVVLRIAKADRQPQCYQEIMDSIEKHIRHFCDVYMEV